MISENELKKLFTDNSINLYQAITAEDIYQTKCLKLAENNIDGLINFITENRISVAFFEYFHYNKEAYCMNPEEFENISDEVMAVIMEDIKEYNSKTELIDYSSPYILRVFCNYGYLTVFVSIIDDWLTEQGVIPAGTKLEELLDKYEPALNEIFSNREEKRSKLLDELSDFIKNDSEFLKCTNANFRRSYFYNLAEREETQKFIEIIRDDMAI